MTLTITNSSPISSKQPTDNRRMRSSVGTLSLKNIKEAEKVNNARRRHMNDGERRKILENDPLIEPGSIHPNRVACKICKAIVKLDSRTNYLAHNWKKHMCPVEILKYNLDSFKAAWEERIRIRKREEAAMALLCLREKDVRVAISVQ
ncbi:hypothetical protein GYMLUDRAFT_243916 [Collybiopsis luxurians FD-317 M1]|uniref:Uncharacterized protein n=1 Tax=Collybiopsis luxurians FD-317 M1 TaxID=944289 RepID=A0A0D0CFC4_9AGAR|nr:hypothetical protein GYMLUDRAFT_243916 [Collybiopsis luxurians FD-317 M1]